MTINVQFEGSYGQGVQSVIKVTLLLQVQVSDTSIPSAI